MSLSEPATEPVSLERFYDAHPETWTDEELAIAVELQRAEREKRLARKERATERKRIKEETG